MNEKVNVSPAKSARHRARELALQGLYQWRIAGADINQIDKTTRDEKSLGRYDVDLFVKLLRGASNQQATLDEKLSPLLDRPLVELSPVEYSVLLLSAYELANLPEIPYRVIINEGVELAKTFGGSDGHKFVNGVLDKLAAQLRAVEVAANT
jgi:N utilization substance protein B